MQQKQWTNRDKTAWADGPWTTEPDKMQWPDQATGLPCLINRNNMGALCGYVGVPEGHPWHGVNYAAIQPQPEVHGGLTYSALCFEAAPEGFGVCHIPEPGEPDNVWWLGFDTAHAGDVVPGIDRNLGLPIRHGFAGDTYKTISYVQIECAHLAAQCAAQRKEPDGDATPQAQSSHPE